jgi:hypothetical protein
MDDYELRKTSRQVDPFTHPTSGSLHSRNPPQPSVVVVVVVVVIIGIPYLIAVSRIKEPALTPQAKHWLVYFLFTYLCPGVNCPAAHEIHDVAEAAEI